VCCKNGFLETKVIDKGGDLFFPNITIHVSHKDDTISSHLPSRNSKAKVVQESQPGLAGVLLAE